ncbi:receptor expression-enhancing protein 2-like isoform X2 [Artemia franciscana]|uniref:receptor expression-enhancing protein 2-like isoform X2 n=1 Tax=Artemia franciscana TaxID=6661 RepID=UPI0032DAAB22
MVAALLSRVIVLALGTLYPAYASYKAIRTKDVREYVKWMMYWVVFAFFTIIETMTDLVLSFWFPLYYECKMIIVLWLLLPATQGSSFLYRRFVHPMLTNREKDIDEFLGQAKDRSYRAALDLASRGVNYATQLIMTTALRGSEGFLQLTRSYSTGDVPRMRNTRALISTEETDNVANNRRSLPPVIDDSEEDESEFHPVSEPNYVHSRQHVVVRKGKKVEEESTMFFSEYSPRKVEPELRKSLRSAASETIYQSVNDSGRPRTPSDVGVSSHQRAGSVRMRASSRDNPDRGSTTSINAIEERRPRRKIAQSDEPWSLNSSDLDFSSEEDNIDLFDKETCPYHGYVHSNPRNCKYFKKLNRIHKVRLPKLRQTEKPWLTRKK